MYKAYKARTDLSDAIFKIDSEKIIDALSKGAKINKSNTNKNTINYAIELLLSNPVEKFSTKFIEVIFDAGGNVCNSGTDKNTLEIVFNGMNDYIDGAKKNNNDKMAKKNILELLNLILSKGATTYNNDIIYDIINYRCGAELEIIIMLCEYKILPDVLQAKNFSLNCAVEIHDLELIKVLCEQKASPGISQDENNTLTRAVRTNNLEIVRIICENSGIPNNLQTYLNTLSLAAETNNPEIIYAIVLRGGKPNNFDDYYICHHNTFNAFHGAIYKCKDVEKFNRSIYLLMCSGITISHHAYRLLMRKPDTHYKRKLISCYHLLEQKNFQHDLNELRIELIKTMKELMEGPVPKRSIVEQIDIGIQRYIPIPCVEIIYEYQNPAPLVQFIDWSKY